VLALSVQSAAKELLGDMKNKIKTIKKSEKLTK
jgi:hypothetical protein